MNGDGSAQTSDDGGLGLFGGFLTPLVAQGSELG